MKSHNEPTKVTLAEGDMANQGPTNDGVANTISVEEVLNCEGDPQRLTDLVKARYAINDTAAQVQVTSFLAKC